VWTIPLLIAVCLITIPAQAKYGGGSGTADDPYQIATAADLIALGEDPNDYDKHFKLVGDIDLAGHVFDKAVISPFTGVFDGNAHTISHLTINRGLFGQMSGEVKDLGVVHVNIIGSGDRVGGMVGSNRGALSRCYSTGVVSGTGSNVGGLVGENNGGSIAASYTTCTVSGRNYVGGLVGRNGGNVTGCYSSGAVSGTGYNSVGGLVGSNDLGGSIATSDSAGSVSATGSGVGGLVGSNWGNVTQCYSTGAVSSESNVGGLVGQNSGTVEQCCNRGAVTGTGYNVGGLVGWSDGSIATSYNTGTVSGEDWVGGLVGDNRGSITRSYSTGAVTGDWGVGGLVGGDDGPITASYSTGPVTGDWGVGGLVGRNDGPITASYSSGPVSGKTLAGGLVARNYGTALYSVWDMKTSGLSRSAGGVGLTTAEMMDPYMLGLNGFANDPNWILDAGRDYPRLAWQGTPGEIIPEPDINWLEGCGTAEDPYRIDTAEQLIFLGRASALCDSYFVLSADIDLDPNLPSRQHFGQAVILSFTGVFDGNGHTISHLTIDGENYLGLFGRLESGAKVRNLAVVDVNISGSGDYVGGLVGCSYGPLTHCYSTGSVSGTGYCVGGLVGSNAGTVTNCYSTCTVSGTYAVGGLVGTGSPAQVMHSVWDIETSGLLISAGGVGLTTAEMMDPYMLGLNGFANDPNWVLDAARDYPRLVRQGTPGEIIPEPHIDWLEGQGTPEGPYRIDTADQLILLTRVSILWDKHFVLAADIDMDPDLVKGHIFAQAVIPTFTGVFDGNGHTILNLTITGKSYLGLFGQLGSEAEVKDLGIVDVNIPGSGSYVGGLVGFNRGTVNRCYSTGAVSGGDEVGGLLGSNEFGGAVTGSYSTAVVTGTMYVGGLVGENSGTVEQCCNRGAVTGTRYNVGGLVGDNAGDVTECYNAGVVIGADDRVGGLVGRNSDGSVTQSYNTGVVIGMGSSVGGVVGYNESGDVTQCYSTGAVIGTGSYVGGLVGWNDGTITTSYSTGAVNGKSYSAGGLVGSNSGPVTLCYSTGAASGTSSLGGLVGSNSGPVTLCYSTGAVSGTGGSVGGLVGSNGGSITASYNTGTVSGNSSVGGLVGSNSYGGSITRSYTSGPVTGTGQLSYSVGGLVGENDGAIATSYSTGVVSASSSVGGLVGRNESGTVANCCTTGAVSGTSYVGGLVGRHWYGSITTSYSTGAVTGTDSVGGLVGGLNTGRWGQPGVVSNCFWDTETSGQATSAGGTGKTTAGMQTASTFLDAGWDFVGKMNNGTEYIWAICEGRDYPHLAWEFVMGDFDADADTDFADFCIFAEHWLAADGSFWCGAGGTDLTNDGKVDFDDFRYLAENWLAIR